jgi:hypothetical protein
MEEKKWSDLGEQQQRDAHEHFVSRAEALREQYLGVSEEKSTLLDQIKEGLRTKVISEEEVSDLVEAQLANELWDELKKRNIESFEIEDLNRDRRIYVTAIFQIGDDSYSCEVDEDDTVESIADLLLSNLEWQIEEANDDAESEVSQ